MSNFGTTLMPGDTFQLSMTGNTLLLNFTPVPEPAAVLLAAGLGLLVVRRRVFGS